MDSGPQTVPKLRELGPGAPIGKYTVVRRLARGGMAEVYLAREAAFVGVERFVALKVILPHMAGEPRFLSMFKAEARVAATLDHPNIAQVLDAGEVDGEPYLVMEYVHGRTIQSLLRTATEREIGIPRGAAIALVIAACSGLHYAHERRDLSGQPLQIVHRDVSPSNLMCRYDGTVKLLDFGIAKAASQTSATQTGFFKGKSGYMSPEQCADEPLDRRSDVFNLGILLYELTTARKAFFGDNPVAVINKIANGRFTPPAELVPDYPAELERIVMQALAVTPEERFATAEELQLALETFVRARRLDASSTARAALMRAVFGDEPYPSLPPSPAPAAEIVTHTELAAVPVLLDADDPSLAVTVARRAPPSRKRAVVGGLVAVTVLLGVAAAAWTSRDGSAEAPPATEASRAPASVVEPAQDAVVGASADADSDDTRDEGTLAGPDVDDPAAATTEPVEATPPVPTAEPTTPEPARPSPRARAQRSNKRKKAAETKRKGPAGMYP